MGDSRGVYGAQAEEGWADGNCCFISDSANLARPPLCLLPNYERERIRRNEGRSESEGDWEAKEEEKMRQGRRERERTSYREGNDVGVVAQGRGWLEVNSAPLLPRN